MTPKLLRTAILASLPLICLSAAATKTIGAFISIDGVPSGASVRDCATHTAIQSVAWASDINGNNLNEIDGNPGGCVVAGFANGTTQETGGFDAHTTSTCQFINSAHHHANLVNSNSDGATGILCQGRDPNTNNLGSQGWVSDLHEPQSNVTRCVVQEAGAVRTQFSTDGGKHYGTCASRQMEGWSVGFNR
jgi:hypothetical protein